MIINKFMKSKKIFVIKALIHFAKFFTHQTPLIRVFMNALYKLRIWGIIKAFIAVLFQKMMYKYQGSPIMLVLGFMMEDHLGNEKKSILKIY